MVEKAPLEARKLLSVLRSAKSQQDLTAQASKGRGVWLSSQLWQAVTKQLELQVSEVESLQHSLKQQEKAAEDQRRVAAEELSAREHALAAAAAQAAELLAEVAKLKETLAAKQDAWDAHKKELEAQADRLLGMLHERQGLLSDNDGLQSRLGAAAAARAAAERRSAEAEARAAELQRLYDYVTGKAGAEVSERDAQAMRLRDLSTALADARYQVETYRQQLAARSAPAEELTAELRRLRGDNGRLVALLTSVPEYRALAAEAAAEGGLHYLPLEECLLQRGLVEGLYSQLRDRPVEDIPGGLAGAGRRRDPDGPDPSLTAVLDEQYHWVPRPALQAGAALLRRLHPGLPMAQLLALVAELNKVWRDREKQRLAAVAAAHKAELRQLAEMYQQRAPYEAVLAGQKVTDLKRRLRAQAAQASAATSAAKDQQRRGEDDSKAMLHAGLSSIAELSKQVARLTVRNKKASVKAARKRAQEAAHAAVQPVCSACVDRLLVPASAAPGRHQHHPDGAARRERAWEQAQSMEADGLTGEQDRSYQQWAHEAQHEWRAVGPGEASPAAQPMPATAAAARWAAPVAAGAGRATVGKAGEGPPQDGRAEGTAGSGSGPATLVGGPQGSGAGVAAYPQGPLVRINVGSPATAIGLGSRSSTASRAAGSSRGMQVAPPQQAGTPTRHQLPARPGAADAAAAVAAARYGHPGSLTLDPTQGLAAASAASALFPAAITGGGTVAGAHDGPAQETGLAPSMDGSVSTASLAGWRAAGGGAGPPAPPGAAPAGGGGALWPDTVAMGAGDRSGGELTFQLPGSRPGSSLNLGMLAAGPSVGPALAAAQQRGRGTPVRLSVAVHFPRRDLPA